jgi:DNA-directed RNA polymerase specialized sigma24 family protein
LSAALFLPHAPRDETLWGGIFFVAAGALAPSLKNIQLGGLIKADLSRRQTNRTKSPADEFDEFVERQRTRLGKLAILLTSDVQFAAVLTRDTLSEVYAHWAEIPAPRREPYAFQTLIALVEGTQLMNITLERSRWSRLAGRSVSMDWGLDVSISRAVNSMSMPVRATFLLRYALGMSVEAISHTLGTTVPIINDYLHQGLAALADAKQRCSD